MTTITKTRPMRADARENRAKLLAAAVELFAATGTEVSLDAIARRAGVGIGTLYRHFPTRDALVEAAYRNEVDQLCGAAPELLAGHPPEVALAEWMDRFVTYAATKRGMSEALQSVVASRSDLFADTKARLLHSIATLLQAGAAAGTIRADARPDDVMRAMAAVFLTGDEPGWDEQARRMLGLLLDGLRHTTR
jgi:AcrR family transcriptional regulator